MKSSELIRALTESGFRLQRSGKKHLIYTDGTNRFIMSHGQAVSPHTARWTMSRLRRVVQMRTDGWPKKLGV